MTALIKKTTEIKLITVNQKTVGKEVQPRILFTGDWLAEFGFKAETLVTAIYKSDVLKLEAHDTGIETYKSLVTNVRHNKGQIFQVLNAVPALQKNKGRSIDLVIDGQFLVRLGFHIGDILIIRKTYKKIELRKFNPLDLGLNDFVNFQLAKVGKYTSKTHIFPCITIGSTPLIKCGFTINTHLKATFLTETIHFSRHDDTSISSSNKRSKTHLTVLGKSRQGIKEAYISMLGAWVENLGYRVGDYLVLGMKQDNMIIKRIDLEKLLF